MVMNTILILTVGGSHQPILRSIEQNQPDMVHFLCSEDTERSKGSYLQVVGEGKVLKSDPKLPSPDLPNIKTMARLGDLQVAVQRISGFDNLNDCYLTAAALIDQLHNQHPDSTIVTDYTGGTKSMTAGLASAALDDGCCEIQLVTGLRANLERVADRTEFARPVRVWDVQVHRRLRIVQQFLSRYDYASAAHALEETARRFASEQTVQRLTKWLALCRGFDAWDRFDHAAAQQVLRPLRGHVDEHKKFLEVMLADRGHGFELVEDLLRNAERREAQERYDDAVGRLYRALELTAQRWLKLRYGIDTGSVDPDLAPSSQRDALTHHENEQGVIKIGLRAAWDLIAAFADDPLGTCFGEHRKHVLNFLTVRNESLFAHGLQPIGARDYQTHVGFVTSFVEQSIEMAMEPLGKRRIARLLQFPSQWD
jgi:hypothetical protein